MFTGQFRTVTQLPGTGHLDKGLSRGLSSHSRHQPLGLLVPLDLLPSLPPGLTLLVFSWDWDHTDLPANR